MIFPDDQLLDFSTLKLDKIRQLPDYYKVIGASPSDTAAIYARAGTVGTFLMPPGHPAYFVRQVSLGIGPQFVIVLDDTVHAVDHDIAGEIYGPAIGKRLMSFWKKLHLRHWRTQAWIRACYAHFYYAYTQPPRDVMNPDRDEAMHHAAVALIRHYYPTYTPNHELIKNPPSGGWRLGGTCWTTQAKRPLSHWHCQPPFGGRHLGSATIPCPWCGKTFTHAKSV